MCRVDYKGIHFEKDKQYCDIHIKYPELPGGGEQMRLSLRIVAVVCVVLAAGALACVPAVTSLMNPDQDSIKPAIGTQAPVFRLNGITYYIQSEKFTLDPASHTINVYKGQPFLMKAKGTAKGLPGFFYILDYSFLDNPDNIEYIIIPAGATKTVSKAFRFNQTGDYLVRVQGGVEGMSNIMDVHIHVM